MCTHHSRTGQYLCAKMMFFGLLSPEILFGGKNSQPDTQLISAFQQKRNITIKVSFRGCV